MNFFGIGTGEILLILVIATLVVGPERMVELARQLGDMLRRFRETTESVTREFRDVISLEEAQQAEGEEGGEAAVPALPAGSEVESEPAESASTEGAAALPQVAALPAPADAAMLDAVQLEAGLASKLVDGEIETESSADREAALAQGGVADLDQPDVEPTVIEVAELVPEEVEAQPTLVEQVVVVGGGDPGDGALEEES